VTGLALKVPPVPLRRVSPIMQVFEKPAEKPGNRGNLLMLVDGALKVD
jgi:hypothetical protein